MKTVVKSKKKGEYIHFKLIIDNREVCMTSFRTEQRAFGEKASILNLDLSGMCFEKILHGGGEVLN